MITSSPWPTSPNFWPPPVKWGGRLTGLRRKYALAGSDTGRASYKGKITRYQIDIESLEAKISRLYPGV